MTRTFNRAAAWFGTASILALAALPFTPQPAVPWAPAPVAAPEPRVPFDVRSYRGENDGETCLAYNVYFEARGESFAGQIAVAQVTLQRLADPRFPKRICEVVWQKGQFTWTDEGKTRVTDRHAWDVARAAARLAIDAAVGHSSLIEYTPPQLATALRYHTEDVAPQWVGFHEVAKIGHHEFFSERRHP